MDLKNNIFLRVRNLSSNITVSIILPKKRQNPKGLISPRGLWEKRKIPLSGFARDRRLLLHKSHLKEAPITKTMTKRQKEKNNKKRKRSSGKVSTVVNVKGEEFDN